MDIKKEVEDETLDYSIVKEEYCITEDASVSVKKVGNVLAIQEKVKSEFIEVEDTSNQPCQYPTLVTISLPPHVEDETLNSFIVKEEYCINENATVSVKKIGDNAKNQDFPTTRTYQLRKSPPPLIYFTRPAPDDKSFKCSQCNESFKTQSLLDQHSKTHKVDVPIPSSTCQKPSETATSLKMHHIKKPHMCETCGLKFQDRHHMYLHIRRVHESNKGVVNIPKRIKCLVPNCPKELKYLSNLKKHMIVHSTETPFECPKCPRKFKAKHMLVGHLHFHENETILLTCDICNKKFQSKNEIRRHMVEHTTWKARVTCQHCSQIICKEYLATHMEKQHKGLPFIEEKEKHIKLSGKRLQCPQCDKSYEARSSLKRHMQLHIEGMSISCPICNNSFKTAGYLKHHMKMHGEKPFKCQQCYKSYATTTALKLHVKKHKICKKIPAEIYKKYESKKVYICLHCGKHLKDRSSYTDHKKVHEVKTIECPDPNCSLKFKYQHNLDKHMIIHSVETPFPCPKCPRKFKTKHVLSRHVRLHEKEISTMKCDLCKSLFSSKISLRDHLQEHIDGKEKATLLPESLKETPQ